MKKFQSNSEVWRYKDYFLTPNTRLPNLKSVHVFMEVARVGFFRKQLRVSACPRQLEASKVSGLEAYFGHGLFLRFHRLSDITDYWRSVWDVAQDAFDRFEKFEAAYPNVGFSDSVALGMSAPPSTSLTRSVVWGRGAWTGCRFEPLMTNRVFPWRLPLWRNALVRARVCLKSIQETLSAIKRPFGGAPSSRLMLNWHQHQRPVAFTTDPLSA